MDKTEIISSRHFLFETEPVVSFIGTLKTSVTPEELQKALRKLEVREPLIGCTVSLDENGSAYFVPESAKPSVTEVSGDYFEIIKERRNAGFDVSERLFDFYLIDGTALGIFAHIIAADCKSLAVLAGEIMGYVDNSIVSVLPQPIRGINCVDDIPSDSVTPVTFKFTDSLNDKWYEINKSYSLSDFNELEKAYASVKGVNCIITAELDSEKTAALRAFCSSEKIDFSSLVMSVFWDCEAKALGKMKPAFRKISAYYDARKRLSEPLSPCAGNLTTRLVFVPPKQKQEGVAQRAKELHSFVYKKYINDFYFFNYITFFMGIEPFLSDSQYFTSFCGLKSNPSKRIAKTRGAVSYKALAYKQHNLMQGVGEKLVSFSDVLLLDPHANDEALSVTCICFEGKTRIVAEFKKSYFDDEASKKVFESAISSLNEIKQ